MNNKQTENRVCTSFRNATPDNLNSVKSDCQAVTAARRPATKVNYWRWASLAMALVLIVGAVTGGIGMYTQTASAATVSMDVNPSLSINLNGAGKVLSVTAHNEEAKQVVGTMDFNGCSLEVTVYALIGSMYSKGYLSEMSNSVLVDVETSAAGKKEKLEGELTEQITQAMKNNKIDPNVIISAEAQTEEEKKQSADIAEQYNMSVAKARLIVQILRKDTKGTHKAEDLAKLKVNDLSLILTGLTGKESGNGTTSQGSYIGLQQAFAAAKEAFGLNDIAEEELNNSLKVRLDYEDGRMVYEVEFVYNGYEYECEVVAARMATDSGKVYKLSIESVLKSPAVNEQLDDATKEKIVEQAFEIAKVSEENRGDIQIEWDIEEDERKAEIEFVYNGTKFDFEFDFDGTLLEYKLEIEATVTPGADDYKDKLNDLIREKLSFLNLPDIELNWEKDEQEGSIVEYKSVYESRLTGATYEFEIKIDINTGAVLKIDYEVDYD